MSVIDEIVAERMRQIEVEGRTPGDDDIYNTRGEMADAAACYAAGGNRDVLIGLGLWPWSPEWWKPKSRRRDLVRAAALIIAEIERLDRLPSHSDTQKGDT